VVDLIVTGAIFMFETTLKVLSVFTPMNPKILQEKYYEKHKHKIKKLEDELGRTDADARVSRVYPKLHRTAARYAFRANLSWGQNIRQQYRSAWFNVLAAEIYKFSNSYESAGGHFHFAAHGFRELGEYEFAGRYYRESALCYQQADKLELAIRACKRGIAVYAQVEEHSEAEKLRNLVKQIE
jgi:hypothetical protein